MITGKDLFDKGIPGNLSKASLKKAGKKKSRLVDLISDQLPFLTEFYFGKYQKPEQRAKYERSLLQVLGSEPYFIDPLEEIVKKAVKKKKLDKLPEGLSAILMDNVDEVRRIYREQIENLARPNKKGKEKYQISGDQMSRLEQMKELTEQLVTRTGRICEILNIPIAKKLVNEIGMAKEYAVKVAAAFVPPEVLNPANIRRYVYRLNVTLYNVQKEGVTVKENDKDTFVNNVGCNLADQDVIRKIYEIFYKGIDRKTFISMLVGIMLERRGPAFDKFTTPQLNLYREISNLVVDVLEGEQFINVEKKKLSSKKAKKLLSITKKELRAFMKLFSEERSRDAARNNDSPRRIAFSSLDEGEYPKVTSAFRDRNKDYFNELLDVPERNNRNRQKQNNGKGNQNNRDRDNNRNNNKRR